MLGYGKQLATQRKVIEEAVFRFRNIADGGIIYLFNHNLLQILSKSLWPRLLSDFCTAYGMSEDNLTKEQHDKINQLN
jgi:hypothetical protein